MDIRDLAKAAITVLEEKGWCKDPGMTGRKVCLGQALQWARTGPLSGVEWMHPVNRIIGELFPGRACGERFLAVRFNDHPDTSYEDVLLVLKHLMEDT